MRKKAFFIIACCLILASSINFIRGNQTWSNYLKSKLTELSQSSYTSLIPKKTLSYVLPAMTVIPGALIGKIIAEEKFMLPMPEDPILAFLTPRKNYEIVRSWAIIGGLAALAAYKIISSYYQQPSKPKDDNATSLEKEDH